MEYISIKQYRYQTAVFNDKTITVYKIEIYISLVIKFFLKDKLKAGFENLLYEKTHRLQDNYHLCT